MTQGFELVFGLTADPIHLGHEQVIINSINYLREKGGNVKSFHLIPVYSPNLIADKKSPRVNYKNRFAMCEIVAKRLSKSLNVAIIVNEIERTLSEKYKSKNYSVDTLNALKLKRGLFIASADHFKGRWPKFRKWNCWQELVSNTGLLINQRPGHKINQAFIQQLKTINPDVFISQSKTHIDTSSTFIRNNYSKKKDMSAHLSRDVINYITAKKLYT